MSKPLIRILPLVGLHKSGHYVEQGGFTCTAGAHDADKLTGAFGDEYVAQADAAGGELQFVYGDVEAELCCLEFLVEVGHEVAVVKRVAGLCFDGAAVREEVHAVGLHHEAVQHAWLLRPGTW